MVFLLILSCALSLTVVIQCALDCRRFDKLLKNINIYIDKKFDYEQKRRFTK